MNERRSITSGGISRSGCQRQNSARVTDVDKLELITMEITEAQFELKEVKKSLTNVKKDLDELMSLYDSWKFKFPHRTHDALLQHMKNVLKPAYDYYN